MSGHGHGDQAKADTKEWERRQKKAFSQWCGILLQEKDFDLLDLSKGVTFFNLVENLMKKPLPFNWQKPMSKKNVNQLEAISCLQRAVDALNKEGVARDVSGKDIFLGNMKLLMGMVWNFILKFQVVDKQLLYAWCEKTCEGFGVPVTNFGSSWVDGRAFGCLISSLRPDVFTPEQVGELKPENKLDNLVKVFATAEEIGIQSMLEPDDMLSHRPNERIIMLYLSYFYKMATDDPPPKAAPPPPPPAPVVVVDNSEIDYLKAELESMVNKYRALQKKYESLRLRSKEEATYLINSQETLLRQFQNLQVERTKLNKKLKSVKAKTKLMEAEQGAAQYKVDPPGKGPVAIVSTGVQGSAGLWKDYPAVMGDACYLHNALIKNIAFEFGGYEMKWEGDSYTFVFGKLSDAIEFCTKVQLMMPSEHWPKGIQESKDCEEVISKKDPNLTLFSGLRVKMGLAKGEANRIEDPSTKKVNFSGSVLNKSLSLCKAAAGGQILLPVDVWMEVRNKVAQSSSEPSFFPIGEFSFSEMKLVEEVGQVVPKMMTERYFPPILSDQNLDEVSQVLADELTRLTEENKKLKNSIGEMETKAEDARRRASLLQTWLESMSESGDASITQDSEFLTITRDITTLAKEKDELSQHIDSLKEENKQMADYLASLNEDLREARALAYGLKDKVEYLKGDKKAAVKRVDELEEELNTLKQRKHKIEEAKEMKTEEVVVLTEENKHVQEQIIILQEEIEELKKHPKKERPHKDQISWIEPVPKKSREEKEREKREREERKMRKKGSKKKEKEEKEEEEEQDKLNKHRRSSIRRLSFKREKKLELPTGNSQEKNLLSVADVPKPEKSPKGK